MTPKTKTSKVRQPSPAAAPVARHLAATPNEFTITEFEQALICAAEAFYRFYGVLLGRQGREHNLSGQDNVILQQTMAASRPLGVADFARFGNRDDIANIQYSLKKLLRAGLIEKGASASVRETTYMATAQARTATAAFLQLRRELFTDPTSELRVLQGKITESAKLLNTLAGFYDHGTRVMASREQTGVDGGGARDH